jgi:hypothetical protein
MVAVSGGDLPQGRGGGPARFGASGTPAPTTWILYDTSATGDNTGSTGMQIATQGTWPPQFDALPDGCH